MSLPRQAVQESTDEFLWKGEMPHDAPEPFFENAPHGIRLYCGDALELLKRAKDEHFDLIFADPPYFLSNDGITCHAGRMVSVNKGVWDKAATFEEIHEFNKQWLRECRRLLKPNGAIWVTGTAHNIYSVGFALQTLGFKILNDIAWYKVNPPPNLSCRYFTHATETILWARRAPKSRHTFNYAEMKRENRDRQMQSLWHIKPPGPREKRYGKHPTQKPEALLDRILRASTNPRDLVLDPFCGSGTTGVAAARLGRRFVGFELDEKYLDVAANRVTEEVTTTGTQSSLFFEPPVTVGGGGGLRVADLSFYHLHYGVGSADAAFDKFIGTLQNYFDADYYVGWGKIFQRIEEHRPELHLLSSLCGAQDKQRMARRVLTDYPKVVEVLPILMACRKSVQLLDETVEGQVLTYTFPTRTKRLTEAEVEAYVRFLCDSQILKLLENIESVPDYVTGVEVGMDTNGRKNRGGDCGVKAIRPFVEDSLKAIPFLQWKEEATFNFLKSQGCFLPEAFNGERWDWAFWLKDNPQRLVVMEVNHYGGGGSKLKAIARDYTGRHKSLASAGVGFIWVTDGLGWLKSKKPLREAFNALPYLVNVQLAKDGLLEHALRDLILTQIKGRKEFAA